MLTILLLGSLCHLLREVAWATPQLWTDVAFTALSIGFSHGATRLAGLTAWLARSGQCPLHLRLSSMPNEQNPPQHPTSLALEGAQSNAHHADGLSSAIKAISAHCDRWEELCLDLPYSYYVSLFGEAKKKGMPKLKRVTFLHNKDPSHGIHIEDILGADTFTAAPQLKEVALSNFSSLSLFSPLPWARMTCFESSRLNLADILDMFRCSPLLETCTLSLASGYPPVLSPVIHPSLRTLTLVGSTTALKYLTLPALETLRIDTQRTFTSEQCVQFIRRSATNAASKLRSLSLTVDFISTTALIDCLEVTPFLHELQVQHRQDWRQPLFGNLLLERLKLRDEKSNLVAQLQSLEVLGHSLQLDMKMHGAML